MVVVSYSFVPCGNEVVAILPMVQTEQQPLGTTARFSAALAAASIPPLPPTAIFLDSGGVINDNRRRAPQWLRHLGDFLPTTILGGTASVWAKANTQVMKTFFKDWQEQMRATTEHVAATARAAAAAAEKEEHGRPPKENVAIAFDRAYKLRWIQEMCVAAADSIVGMRVSKKSLEPCLSSYEARWFPWQITVRDSASGDDKVLTDAVLTDLAIQAYVYTLARVQADFPGAVATIRHLKEDRNGEGNGDLRLYTSSGDSSKDLEVILQAVDALKYFDGIYGADKVDCLKCSPVYYQRVFSDAQVDPARVLVLDDNERALGWAKESGAATTVLVIGEEEGDVDLMSDKYRGKVDYRIHSLAELPLLLQQWQTSKLSVSSFSYDHS